MTVYNTTLKIDWDTDGEYVPYLPEEIKISPMLGLEAAQVIVDILRENVDELIDGLSNEYGYCINGISFHIE